MKKRFTEICSNFCQNTPFFGPINCSVQFNEYVFGEVAARFSNYVVNETFCLPNKSNVNIFFLITLTEVSSNYHYHIITHLFLPWANSARLIKDILSADLLRLALRGGREGAMGD